MPLLLDEIHQKIKHIKDQLSQQNPQNFDEATCKLFKVTTAYVEAHEEGEFYLKNKDGSEFYLKQGDGSVIRPYDHNKIDEYLYPIFQVTCAVPILSGWEMGWVGSQMSSSRVPRYGRGFTSLSIMSPIEYMKQEILLLRADLTRIFQNSSIGSIGRTRNVSPGSKQQSSNGGSSDNTPGDKSIVSPQPRKQPQNGNPSKAGFFGSNKSTESEQTYPMQEQDSLQETGEASLATLSIMIHKDRATHENRMYVQIALQSKSLCQYFIEKYKDQRFSRNDRFNGNQKCMRKLHNKNILVVTAYQPEGGKVTLRFLNKAMREDFTKHIKLSDHAVVSDDPQKLYLLETSLCNEGDQLTVDCSLPDVLGQSEQHVLKS